MMTTRRTYPAHVPPTMFSLALCTNMAFPLFYFEVVELLHSAQNASLISLFFILCSLGFQAMAFNVGMESLASDDDTEYVQLPLFSFSHCH